MFNAFMSTCVADFFTTHGQNITRVFYTEGIFSVEILCGIVGSLYWFTKGLICKTRNMRQVVWINSKCVNSSETRACTIIDCAIVCNVRHVTLTWPLIYLWYGADNLICTPRTERPSWKSLEVNCAPATVWIHSKSHQPKCSTFQNLSWKISGLSMTSSVVMFPIPQIIGNL